MIAPFATRRPLDVKRARSPNCARWTEKLLRYKNEFCRAALKIYDDGADGISTFNCTPHHQPGNFKRIGRASWGLGVKRVQAELARKLGDREAIRQYLEQPAALSR